MGRLNPQFTFESFVVGPSNRLASAAARRAAERPGVSYNPLFIHAPSGLGKTHILGAIARHIERIHPKMRVEYLTSTEILRQFAGASGMKREEAVEARFEDVDILLLDDVQLLIRRPEGRDLLLYTLRAMRTLAGGGKQVVLTSDRPPREIEGLETQLLSRFEGGLVVDIGVPGYETRVAILLKLAELRGAYLEPGLADVIGRKPSPSVVQMSEALSRVLEAQERKGRSLTQEEASLLLEGQPLPEEDKNPSELGQFLDELVVTVSEKVEAQEAPWRRLLREAAERAEGGGFNASPLRKRMEERASPADLTGFIEAFEEAVHRLGEIGAELEEVGNPWPEAAHGVLKDPDRLEEAEGLLASAQERATPFPEIPPGPDLEGLRRDLPKLVVRAAEQLVFTDRAEYNPLYVWSSDGAAARVLLHAAGRSRLAAEKESVVALGSAEGFAEDFIRALSAGVAGAWRERWWAADLLLLDGAESLSGTERAQEELFHLLEALGRRRARIMVAADRPPSRISALDDRLRARLEGGLVIEIEVGQADLPTEVRQSVQEPVSPPRSKEPERKDLAAEDLEWIKSFRPKAAPVPGGDGKSEEDAEERVEKEAWVPSPEKVVLVWPRLAERIVEGEE